MGNACSDSAAVDSAGGLHCCGPPEVGVWQQLPLHAFSTTRLNWSRFISEKAARSESRTHNEVCKTLVVAAQVAYQ